MPNPANVQAPIVLIGTGRSGTSLVSDLFNRHPDCVSVGETANLIFGTWQAVEYSASLIRAVSQGDGWVAEDDRAAEAVRQVVLSCLPDDSAHWMQKPIGVPKAVSDRFTEVDGDDAAAWYWRVMRTAFPEARYVAIIRHPCDVVLSGRSWWGYSEHSLWNSIGIMSAYLLHADSPVRHVVDYADLMAAPEATVRAMCDAVGLAFDEAMMAAFKKVHVAASGRENLASTGYTRRADWHQLDPTHLLPRHRATIDALFVRYSRPLEWPAHFDAPPSNVTDQASADEPATPSAGDVNRLRTQVRQLEASIERMKLDHAVDRRRRDEAWIEREQAFMARDQEMGRLWAEQQAWITHLEEVKKWYQEQLGNWQRHAERLKAASEAPRPMGNAPCL